MKCPVCQQVATPLGRLGGSYGGERVWLCPTGARFISNADHSIYDMPTNHPNPNAQPPCPTYTLEQVEEALDTAFVSELAQIDDCSFDRMKERLRKRLTEQGSGKGCE